jgi:AraC family transcriptional regulator of adaptative response / DNA-3-methyladenine glycosylase II
VIPSDDICRRAFAARDARFDGVFFTGVKSTGIYCRPVCPARAPRASACRFFESAAAAERAGFRPCLRCRPELAPGRASDGSLGEALCRVLQSGALEGLSVAEVAVSSGFSERQMRRLVVDACGVTPVDLMQTQRLLFAKKLMHETRLTLGEIASVAGFGSLRRLNALFAERYGMPPTAVRMNGFSAAGDPVLTLRVAYRRPMAWREMLEYWRRRATPGVELVTGGVFARTARFGAVAGVVRVREAADAAALLVEIPPALAGHSARILRKVRECFDLEARPDLIDAHLGSDPALAPLVRARPGLRVPGAWDRFEMAVRTVLGQRISVAGATTLAGRLARRFGEPVPAACREPGLERLGVSREALARASAEALTALGLTRSGAAALRGLARFAVEGGFEFAPGTSFEAFASRLESLPGIGPWTTHYLGMRALRFPDAFPAGDLGLQKALGWGARLSERELLRRAERWRPWRAYAAAHLWASLPPPRPEFPHPTPPCPPISPESPRRSARSR